MRIVVLGSNGQLGRGILETFSQFTGNAPTEIQLIGIADRNPLARLEKLGGIDVVIDTQGAHPRAMPGPTASDYIDGNVNRLIAVLQMSRAKGCSRYVFISSNGIDSIDTSENRNGPPQLYSVTKLLAEELLRSQDTTNFEPLIVRLPQILANSDLPKCFLGQLAKDIYTHAPLKLFGVDKPLPFTTPAIVAKGIVDWLFNTSNSRGPANFSAVPTLTLGQIVDLWTSLEDSEGKLDSTSGMGSEAVLRRYWVQNFSRKSEEASAGSSH